MMKFSVNYEVREPENLTTIQTNDSDKAANNLLRRKKKNSIIILHHVYLLSIFHGD